MKIKKEMLVLQRAHMILPSLNSSASTWPTMPSSSSSSSVCSTFSDLILVLTNFLALFGLLWPLPLAALPSVK